LELDGNVRNWFALAVLASSGDGTVLAVEKIIVNDGDIQETSASTINSRTSASQGTKAYPTILNY